MKTKLLSLLVALSATTALWAYDCKIDGINYSLNTIEMTAEVRSGTYSGFITIPSSITYESKTYSVTTIGELAFWRSSLIEVTIGDSVTTIGSQAFLECDDLRYVTIPNSVTTIEKEAFCGCFNLTSITIPNSVTTIGENAFLGCESLPIEDNLRYADTYLVEAADRTLSSYTIKEGTKWVGDGAFAMCYYLTSVTIPNTVTTIGTNAFQDCERLTSITIPNSVTTIGEKAFWMCDGLTAPVYNANCFAFMPEDYTGSYTIPSGIKQIAGGAFYWCKGLTSVTIPNSVTTIGDYAFQYCSGLTAPVYNANCFAFMPENYTGSYTIPSGIKQIAGGAFSGCSRLTSVTIPNTVTTIGDWAFWCCFGLTSVTIPNSVTTIGERAFYSCSGLTSVTIPNSVTTIEDYAFYECGLTSVTIPNSVKTIREKAFYKSALTSVTIGNSVTIIGEDAFSSCNILTSIICFAAYPPSFYGEPFWETFVTVYVPASFLSAHQNVWGFKVLPLGADVKPIEGDEPIVTPSDQDVTITWPITDGTDTYTLTITKGGEVVCVLTFNAQGQLVNIAFKAPATNGSSQAPAATLTAQGYQFTVTGLNPGTAYNYSVVATDAGGKTIAEHKGIFSTTGGTGIDNLNWTQDTKHQTLKYLHNGTLLINRNGKHYSAMGERIR